MRRDRHANAARRESEARDLLFGAMLGMALGATACAGLPGFGPPPLQAGWARDIYDASKSRCASGRCRTTLSSAHGPLEVETRAHEYERHEIPGWDDQGKGERAASSVLQWALRRNGATTEWTTIGLGERVVREPGDDGWRLACSVFWIDVEDVEYDKDRGDHVSRDRRATEGLDCRASALADTGAVLWRFRRGIAPSREALAAQFDRLAAEGSADVTASPTSSLERVERDATGGVRYVVEDELPGEGGETGWAAHVGVGTALRVTRENGERVATLRHGMRLAIDVAPGGTADEARVLRLVGAAMAVPLRPTER